MSILRLNHKNHLTLAINNYNTLLSNWENMDDRTKIISSNNVMYHLNEALKRVPQEDSDFLENNQISIKQLKEYINTYIKTPLFKRGSFYNPTTDQPFFTSNFYDTTTSLTKPFIDEPETYPTLDRTFVNTTHNQNQNQQNATPKQHLRRTIDITNTSNNDFPIYIPKNNRPKNNRPKNNRPKL